MKLYYTLLAANTLALLSSVTVVVSAYAPQKQVQQQKSVVANRRDVTRTLFTGLTTSLTGFAVSVSVAGMPTMASAAAARPEYLSEPTDDFKESERQRMEFKAAQLKEKKEFTTVLDHLTNESKTEEDLVTDLKQLRNCVKKFGGMPLGIKKEDMVKIIRRKKALGFWPTPVEIAYQDLFREVLFQQSPNKEKDTMSPI